MGRAVWAVRVDLSTLSRGVFIRAFFGQRSPKLAQDAPSGVDLAFGGEGVGVGGFDEGTGPLIARSGVRASRVARKVDEQGLSKKLGERNPPTIIGAFVELLWGRYGCFGDVSIRARRRPRARAGPLYRARAGSARRAGTIRGFARGFNGGHQRALHAGIDLNIDGLQASNTCASKLRLEGAGQLNRRGLSGTGGDHLDIGPNGAEQSERDRASGQAVRENVVQLGAGQGLSVAKADFRELANVEGPHQAQATLGRVDRLLHGRTVRGALEAVNALSLLRLRGGSRRHRSPMCEDERHLIPAM